MSKAYISKAGYIADCRLIERMEVTPLASTTHMFVLYSSKGIAHTLRFDTKQEAEQAVVDIYRAASGSKDVSWGWALAGAVAVIAAEVWLSLYPL